MSVANLPLCIARLHPNLGGSCLSTVTHIHAAVREHTRLALSMLRADARLHCLQIPGGGAALHRGPEAGAAEGQP